MFGISKTTVGNIWIAWVNFSARQFRDINFWLDRQTGFFSPRDFYHKFPPTRVIIDGNGDYSKKNPNPLLLNGLPFLHTKT